MGYRLLAYFIYRYPGVIMACWMAFFVFFGSLSVQLPSVVRGPGLYTDGSSTKVQQMMEEQLGIPADPVVIVFEQHEAATNEEFTTVIERTLNKIRDLKGLESLISPLENNEFIHGGVAYALLGFDQPSYRQGHLIQEIRSSLQPMVKGVTIQLTGKSIVQEDVNRASMHDFKMAERIGIPVAFIILFISFGGFLYAFIPVLMGMLTVSSAMGMMVLLSRMFDLDLSNFILNVIPMTGLALSLDFAFILTSRFREELRRGSAVSALRATMLTSGRAVYFSAACVVCGLTAVAFIPMPMFESAAVCSIIVVVLAAAINLSLVPALLLLTSPFMQRDRRPLLFLSRSYNMWSSWADIVMRRPARMLAIAGLIMTLLLIPSLHLSTSVPDASSLPAGSESRQADEKIRSHFQKEGTSDVLLLLQPVGSKFTSEERRRAYTWLADLKNDPEVDSVTPINWVDSFSENTYSANAAVLQVSLLGPAGSAKVHEWLRDAEVRGSTTGLNIKWGGEAKSQQEVKDAIHRSLPKMLGFIALSNLIVLFIAFRSILIPLKALVMNMLSIAASFGVLVLVFQTGITGMTPENIAIMIPVFVFGLVFGVSMDYGVFLLSRMSEAFEESGNPENAIRHGMAATGKLITSAAAILIAVTLPFAFGEVEGVRQLGVGIASAVFIDVTLIRLLLVPSLMKLLGRFNWWVPRWLRTS
ncbi:transporter [Paenibacillus sp. J23TS9]|uniref:MMPL family transporter n=1 Tax=Paenibacillus sp. J23TS9 TaxID=2807193 RepID=UPI001B2B7605|nr:MMPL family transporter [Paenibacillus sp. J23TS9]GIP26025.1 transporter [Paenibacillus sp. J23TS9]